MIARGFEDMGTKQNHSQASSGCLRRPRPARSEQELFKARLTLQIWMVKARDLTQAQAGDSRHQQPHASALMRNRGQPRGASSGFSTASGRMEITVKPTQGDRGDVGGMR